MQKFKMSGNEASKEYTSIHKSRLLGTDGIISEIFRLWYKDLFLGTNASNQLAGQQPALLMGPSYCIS